MKRIFDALDRMAAKPTHEQVRAVREVVREALAVPATRVELLEREIAMRERLDRVGMFPFHRHGDVRIAFSYWAPGRAAGAHEHTDWTVTAVFHNRLDVRTYDWDASVAAERLVPKNLFVAEAGRAGHIYEPCIHDPGNPTQAWSMSLHLFGPDDRPVLAWLPRPREQHEDDPLTVAMRAHERECIRRVQIRALGGLDARSLLQTLRARGDAGTRRRAARALGAIDDIDARTRLVRRWPGVILDVQRQGDRVSLIAAGRQPLLSIEGWAESALRRLAGAEEIRPRDLNGIGEAAQLAIARALVDWGTFQPSE